MVISLLPFHHQTYAKKYQNNTKFLLHIESLIRKAKKYSIELNSELVFLELATAVYHDFNGDHQKAIKKLSILKKSIEHLSKCLIIYY